MTRDNPQSLEGQPGLAAAALSGLCPRCGAKSLFAGMLAFAPKCRACGLDLSRFNVGDGPAALVTLVMGAVLVGLAVWVELSCAPPLWLHALLWVPLTFVLVIAGLRVSKAWLLASEYRNNAGEAGRREP